ncbi:putative mitochondrial protein AtMg00710 [Apium graveolens]|uniref:putative mitochondrial protein AtMg00710 n=1 Tax=Apium graveolens TaxID=4045 RepID=UPI003D7AA93B
MTRCMLHEKNLPKKLWAEAANTSVYLLNRLPTSVLQKKTPYEAWYGFKPDMHDIKIFGCLCFSYVPQEKRDKLDKKAEAGVLLDISIMSRLIEFFNHKLENFL